MESDNNNNNKNKEVKRPLDNLQQFKQNIDKSGVVYMSRVPPHMEPHHIKHLLSKIGQIGRLYFAPEDEFTRMRRIKNGGSKKLQYKEGWIEFKDKKVAKAAAMQLNGTQMGGRKMSQYHDDLWNLKYLPKFKWIHLTEQMAYERMERAKRMAAETDVAKKNVQNYLAQVERARVKEQIEAKRRVKRERDEQADGKSMMSNDQSNQNRKPQGQDNGGEEKRKTLQKRFRQRIVVDDEDSSAPKKSHKILSKLFH
ncbi:hypothetical protein MP228_011656 [Amoeboaphelidium protococcarum]|nr:hypothetical protein MP228_011656 [Amoeboaphelidium protococcarum]